MGLSGAFSICLLLFKSMKEETGYIGTVDTTFKSSELCMSPGLCDETIQLIISRNLEEERGANVSLGNYLAHGGNVTSLRASITYVLCWVSFQPWLEYL